MGAAQPTTLVSAPCPPARKLSNCEIPSWRAGSPSSWHQPLAFPPFLPNSLGPFVAVDSQCRGGPASSAHLLVPDGCSCCSLHRSGWCLWKTLGPVGSFGWEDIPRCSCGSQACPGYAAENVEACWKRRPPPVPGRGRMTLSLS